MVEAREARCSTAVAGIPREGVEGAGIPHSGHSPGCADAPATWQPFTDVVTRVDGDRSRGAT